MSAIARLKEHPKGFWFIFWGELAERASFYGMRTVLALYMTSILAFKEENAAAVMHGFIAACYLTPLLGGFLADRVLGRYKTILYFSGPYVLGHIILGGWESRTALFIALVLLALGSGSIKPNTSTLMGQMYEEQKKGALLTEAFSYFYAAINIGSTVATLGLPWLRDRVAAATTAERGAEAARAHGYAVALMVPAALMVGAFAFFAVGKKHYPVEHVRSLPPKTDGQKALERATLVRISGIFALIAVFWFVYDQSASTWIYFAKDHMDLRLGFGFSTTPDQVQGLNPLLIVILTPVFNALWELLKRRRGGVEIPDTRKMLIGFFIVVATMAIMAAVGFAAGDGKVTVWWLCLATLVITLSELCISVVGLEFAFKVAAPGTKSVVTAAFLMTVFLGDFVQTGFNKTLWGTVSAGMFFLIQAVIMAVATALFYGVARRFEQPAEGADKVVVE